MRVLDVVSELYPLVKTGGLADVAGALPAALAPLGIEMHSLLPGYPAVLDGCPGARTIARLDDPSGEPVEILGHVHPAAGHLCILRAPALYERPGGPYGDAGQQAWPDNPQRFAALAWAAAAIADGLLPDWRPDIVHGHDWQAGLMPAYLALGIHPGGRAPGHERPGSVMSIHNLAFQGQAPAGLLHALRLPAEAYAMDGVEYYGSIGFLKAGLHYADRLTTVSPSYALEIQTPAGGMGLDGLLRHRAGDLRGIVNGIDETVWNPARDPHITATYDTDSLDAKALNKASLQTRMGLTVRPDALLACVVSRLTHQKGMDLLLECLPDFLDQGGQLALLGSGEVGLEAAFARAAADRPGAVACVFGYDEPLSHMLQAGADMIVVPSRFEPCGLTQLYALRYGTLPLVARTGGLADTVIDANHAALGAGVATGFQFAPVDAVMLQGALRRAGEAFRAPATWRRMQVNAMVQDLSWHVPAGLYADLYRELASRPASGQTGAFPSS